MFRYPLGGDTVHNFESIRTLIEGLILLFLQGATSFCANDWLMNLLFALGF